MDEMELIIATAIIVSVQMCVLMYVHLYRLRMDRIMDHDRVISHNNAIWYADKLNSIDKTVKGKNNV